MQSGKIMQVRRSERVRKQRYKLNSDDIGDDENDLDEDYIPEEWRYDESGNTVNKRLLMIEGNCKMKTK